MTDGNNTSRKLDYDISVPNPEIHQELVVSFVPHKQLNAAKELLGLRYTDPGNVIQSSIEKFGAPDSWHVLGKNIVGVNSWKKLSTSTQYHFLTNEVAFFIATTMQYLRITGVDSCDFLESVSPRILSNLKINGVTFTLFTNESGTIDDEAVIVRVDKNDYVMSCGSGRVPTWFSRRARLFNNLNIVEPDLCALILFGPKRVDYLTKLVTEQCQEKILKLQKFSSCIVTLFNGSSIRLVRTLIGHEIWSDQDTIRNLSKFILNDDKHIVPFGWDLLDVFRLECDAFPFKLYPVDINSNTTLWEAKFGWLIDQSANRSFIGQKALMDLKGKERFFVISLKSVICGKREDFKIPTRGEPIFNDADYTFVGYITTVGYSFSQSRILAFAHVMLKCEPIGSLRIEGQQYIVI